MCEMPHILTPSLGGAYPPATGRGRAGWRSEDHPQEEIPARVADVAVRLVQLTKRFGGDATGRRVAQSIPGASPIRAFSPSTISTSISARASSSAPRTSPAAARRPRCG